MLMKWFWSAFNALSVLRRVRSQRPEMCLTENGKLSRSNKLQLKWFIFSGSISKLAPLKKHEPYRCSGISSRLRKICEKNVSTFE